MLTRPTNSPLHLPRKPSLMIERAKEIVSACRTSLATRSSYYSELDALAETGRTDGIRSIINTLHYHEDRVAAHLFSPAQLNFTMEADFDYPQETLMKMLRTGKIITRQWQRNNTDMLFGQGVQASGRYGAVIMKQWAEDCGPEKAPAIQRRLVMPWQFGVYREDLEELHMQPAFVETSVLSLPEVWRRIYHMDNARELFRRIETHVSRDSAGNNFNGFAHQILSTAQIDTGVNSALRPMPGGLVNINNAPNWTIQGPELGIKTIPFHELWIWGENDWETIQFIEPDILIYPTMKRGNLLAPGLQPYSLIRMNASNNYFWGRSEFADLIELQQWLAMTADDSKRLLALQVDKILAFTGDEGMTDERYSQFREAGWLNMGQGSDVKDLTPSIPGELLPMMQNIMNMIDKIGGFGNILDGGGEPGVRSGAHAQTLVKTASPTLRDRSLLVERQCAAAADLTYNILRAKDPTTYWVDPDHPDETQFTLAGLPEDGMIVVDSHSGSPIFLDDHENLVSFGVKAGFIDGPSAIELLPFPQKDLLQARLKAASLAKQKELKELEQKDPAAFAKLMSKGGHK